MKIGTTLYSAVETYSNSEWAEISEKCSYIITTSANYSTALTKAPNVTLLYYTNGGLSMSTPTSKTNSWGNITSDMILKDETTPANDAIDSETLSDSKYIMDLSSEDYIANKILELNAIFESCPSFGGIYINVLPYEAKADETWNIEPGPRAYYKQMAQSFLAILTKQYPTKLIIPSCDPINNSGDYTFSKISSGEAQDCTLDESDWESLITYANGVLAVTGKYFFLNCATPSSMSDQDTRDLFRMMGITSNNLILLTDMFS